MCTFASFVDFPFFFWKVSCEGGKVFRSPLVSLDILLVELARTEVSSKETVPSIYKGSTKQKPGDA